MRSALQWAEVRTLAAEGLSQREIARRLGINRGTVMRLARSDGPPHYRRAALGSQLYLLEPVLRQLVEEWPQIMAPRVTEILRLEHGFGGSERLVREHLRLWGKETRFGLATVICSADAAGPKIVQPSRVIRCVAGVGVARDRRWLWTSRLGSLLW